ncbi:MAG: hypothetical protein IPL86_11910 [Flavobacteriales bacterium]|nr:hypothetical protein [Flavobacteriales bacterium]
MEPKKPAEEGVAVAGVTLFACALLVLLHPLSNFRLLVLQSVLAMRFSSFFTSLRPSSLS